MHESMVRTLIDMRHILELRKNLISLSLDRFRYQVSTKGGVFMVSQGLLLTMTWEKIDYGLYLLEGKTVIRFLARFPYASGQAMTRLWHVRLGHMSEREMIVPSQRGLLGGHRI